LNFHATQAADLSAWNNVIDNERKTKLTASNVIVLRIFIKIIIIINIILIWIY